MITEKMLKYALEGKFNNSPHITFAKELLQNSRRSNSREVSLKIQNNIIEYKDDSEGIKHWESLLTLGDSNGQIMNTEDPVGFGLLSLYAISNSVEIWDDKNRVIILPPELQQPQYRDLTIDRIKSARGGKGFNLIAKLKPEISINIKDIENSIKFFYMFDKILLNGKKVKTTGHKELAQWAYETLEYEGNKLYIPLYAIEYFIVRKRVPFQVIWYGELINHGDISMERPYWSVLVVEKDNPLDVSLPYRDNVVQNEKLTNFEYFLQNAIRDIIRKCKSTITDKIYVDVPYLISPHDKIYPVEKQIGLLDTYFNDENIVVISVLDTTESPAYSIEYELSSVLIRDRVSIEEVLKHLSKLGINKIGFVRKNGNLQEIQYIENENIYLFKSKEKDIKLIEGINIIDLPTEFKDCFIINPKAESPFIYMGNHGNIALVCKNKEEVKKTFDLIKENMEIEVKKAIFHKYSRLDNPSDFFAEAEYLSDDLVSRLAIALKDKDKIIKEITSFSSKYLSLKQRKQLENFLKHLL